MNLLTEQDNRDLQFIRFGRGICNDFEAATRLEWLVTNGLGGYAAGSISGALTRRYHGLLIAALKPPVGRTLLVSKLDETVIYQGQATPIFTNRWSGGSVEPHGYVHIRDFRLRDGLPVWIYEIADALLEKTIWMEQGANTSYVRYRLLRATMSMRLQVGLFVNARDHHASTHASGWSMHIDKQSHGLRISPGSGHPSISVQVQDAEWRLRQEWTRDYYLDLEAYRGLDASDDHLRAAEFEIELEPGATRLFVCSTDENRSSASQSAADRRSRYVADVMHTASVNLKREPPAWVKQLILAADQFIVARRIDPDSTGSTVIAGYPWFGDWGRDTMIGLRGLTLATGRTDITLQVLSTYAQFVDQGMLPNHFPEGGELAEYNTVDATLWYFEAVRAYFDATGDLEVLEELYPTLSNILEWHLNGTRHGIKVDETDSLLMAGEPGVQLTWMDAKVGDWVVTPRVGKPVEVNALWYRALDSMVAIGTHLGLPTHSNRNLAQQVQTSFQKFWNPQMQYCFDVIEGPEGNDPSLRPNQLFSVSLGGDLLHSDRARAVVDSAARALYTSVGLRSLSFDDAAFAGHYGGDQRSRDGAYHQGTVWSWLIGPFVEAHYRVYRDADAARNYLEPVADNLLDHGLGSISEIFDGNAPHRPRGCIAQAWSVAELLRLWRLLEE